MINDHKNVVFAKITKFFRGDGRDFGFAHDDFGHDHMIHINSWRPIFAGVNGPEFGGPDFDRYPEIGESIALIPGNRQNPRYFGKAVPVEVWGFKLQWTVAMREYLNRPIFRVRVTRRRFQGHYQKVGEDVITAAGTAQVLQAQYPRMSANAQNDRLGAVYTSYPCSDEQIWEKLEEENWVRCDDPRPYPGGAVTPAVKTAVNA